eukprot:5736698-Amphidinium_carterae.1
MFGLLDGTSFDKYMEAGKGLVWVLLPMDGKTAAAIQGEQRPVMTEVAKKLRGKYFVTVTDTKEYKEAVDSMLSVSEFPAIAVQKTAGWGFIGSLNLNFWHCKISTSVIDVRREFIVWSCSNGSCSSLILGGFLDVRKDRRTQRNPKLRSFPKRHSVTPQMIEIAGNLKSDSNQTSSTGVRAKVAFTPILFIPELVLLRPQGDKKKYVYTGEMTAGAILRFVDDVDAGNVAPKLKSEPPPASNLEPVRVVVGHWRQKLS